MMSTLVALIVASALSNQIRQNINSVTLDFEQDPYRIEQINRLTDNGKDNLIFLLELFLKTPVTDEEVSGILSLMRTDGSWSDINYEDNKISQCEQTWHATRFQRLAVFHHLHPERQDVTQALHRSLRYWGAVMPVTRNWFYNSINIPKLFGAGFLLMLDEMSEEELKIASAQMHRATFNRKGQNLVWLSGNILVAAIIDKDDKLLEKAAGVIKSELQLGLSPDAGLQDDFSFLQHGAMLQFGNYGQSFAVSQSYWCRVLTGTTLAYSDSQIELLKNYLVKGVGRTVWNGYMDMNALGRQVFPSAQVSKALSLRYAAANLSIKDSDIEAGPRYYPRADFCNFRAKRWTASLRMQSNRTIGYEEINGENQKGYFSADGVLMVRVSGDEYFDITPYWNWRHLPGTTVRSDGPELWGSHTDWPYNRTDNVRGKVEGGDMFVWMEYDRDSVKCQKYWLFSRNAIVCVGRSVSGSGNIVTTVEQSRMSSAVRVSGGSYANGRISYVPLDGTTFTDRSGLHKGSWRCAAPHYDDTEISSNLFELIIGHGINPVDASYAYCIVPDCPNPGLASNWVKHNVAVTAEYVELCGHRFFFKTE